MDFRSQMGILLAVLFIEWVLRNRISTFIQIV